MKSIAIVGVGLIGGSFALALRRTGFAGEILGVSSPRTITAACERKIIDRGVTLAEAASYADVLYVAQPIDAILQTLEQLGPLVRQGCLVTDAGSTKAEIVARANRFLPPGAFLGGHPLAGKEQRGVVNADGDLFRNRPYVVTPATPETAAAKDFRGWLERIGANVIAMSPREHDETVGLTSHLPQILSTALASALAASGNPYVRTVFGPGLLDMTRLALSAPEIWGSIVGTNRRAIAEALASFRQSLSEAEAKLLTGEIEPIFHQGAEFAHQIRRPSNNGT